MGFNNPSWTCRGASWRTASSNGRDGRAPGSPSWNAAATDRRGAAGASRSNLPTASPWFAEREELYRAAGVTGPRASTPTARTPPRSSSPASGVTPGGRPPRSHHELAFDARAFDTRAMGFNNPSWTWSQLEAALSGHGRDGRAPGSPSWNAGGDGPAWSRRRQPFQPPEDRAARRLGALRRAALPLQLLLPRRRVPSRGAGHRGGAARPGGARAHGSRRLLRRRPLRRGRQSRRDADRVRHGDHAHARPRCRAAGVPRGDRHADPGGHRPGARQPRPRSPRRAPAAARRRSRRLCPAGPHAEPRAPGGGEGGAAVHARRRGPQHGRRRMGPHRVPQGRRPGGVGGRRPGCGAA